MEPQWFNEQLRSDLDNVAAKQKISPGETLIHADLDQHSTYIIVDGSVRVWSHESLQEQDSCDAILLDDITAIDIVGEIAAIDGKPSNTVIESITPVKAYRIHIDHFSNLMNDHSDLRNHVFKILCERLRSANDRIHDAHLLPSKSRVLKEIIRLALKARLDQNDLQSEIKDFPRHNIIASRCGVTRETVTRAIGCLSKKGIIQRKGRAMIIHNIHNLKDSFHSLKEGNTNSC